MYRNHARPLLALLALILASLACGPQPAIVVGGEVTCRLSYFSGTFNYRCYCPADDSAYSIAYYTTKDLKEIDPQTIKDAACADYYSVQSFQNNNAQAIEPSTEEPTEEPAPTEPPAASAPLQPYLTGAFTTCDNVAGYVNFSIAENAPAYDPATFKVTFNGYQVNCKPAANNPKVLTCNYPPPSYAPPAGVQVFIGEELVNEFDFNGGKICDPAPQPNTNDNEEPAPTEAAPTEEG